MLRPRYLVRHEDPTCKEPLHVLGAHGLRQNRQHAKGQHALVWHRYLELGGNRIISNCQHWLGGFHHVSVPVIRLLTTSWRIDQARAAAEASRKTKYVSPTVSW